MTAGEVVWMFIAAMGIPSAVMGLLMWWLKRHIDKKEAKREEKEKNTERLMVMMMQETRATNVLATATAKAVQRIPDAHCNGDMTEALAKAAQIQNEEKDFLLDQGIKHIFGD
jgi:hypothetical protein